MCVSSQGRPERDKLISLPILSKLGAVIVPTIENGKKLCIRVFFFIQNQLPQKIIGKIWLVYHIEVLSGKNLFKVFDFLFNWSEKHDRLKNLMLTKLEFTIKKTSFGCFFQRLFVSKVFQIFFQCESNLFRSWLILLSEKN